MTHKAVICLGANVPYGSASANIAAAFHLVSQQGDIVDYTAPYFTDAEYAGDAAPYLNQIILLRTLCQYEALQRLFKAHEAEVRPLAQAPLVAIDIDIVMWDDVIVRPADAAARYFAKGIEMLNRENCSDFIDV